MAYVLALPKAQQQLVPLAQVPVSTTQTSLTSAVENYKRDKADDGKTTPQTDEQLIQALKRFRDQLAAQFTSTSPTGRQNLDRQASGSPDLPAGLLDVLASVSELLPQNANRALNNGLFDPFTGSGQRQSFGDPFSFGLNPFSPGGTTFNGQGNVSSQDFLALAALVDLLIASFEGKNSGNQFNHPAAMPAAAMPAAATTPAATTPAATTPAATTPAGMPAAATARAEPAYLTAGPSQWTPTNGSPGQSVVITSSDGEKITLSPGETLKFQVQA